jgi:hypothetical protein
VTIAGGTLAAAGATILVNATTGIGTLAITSGSVTGAPGLTVSGNGVVTLPTSLPSGGRQIVAVSTLSVDQAGGGRIDVGTGRIDVAVGGVTEADLRADVVAGRNGGAFNGTSGIMTTGGKASPTSSNPVVGYRVLVNGTAIVAWAAFGDSNLDGQVNNTDITLINTGLKFNAGGTNAVWSQGDYNYSGAVNNSDITLLNTAALFNAGSYVKPFAPGLMAMVIGGEQDGMVFELSSLDGFTGFDGTPLSGSGVAAVPEPSVWALAVAGAACVGAYRRRKRSS